MKKSLYLLLLSLMLIAFSLAMTACDSDDSDSSDDSSDNGDQGACDHVFAGTYSTGEDAHWFECTKGCGAKYKVGEHVYGDPVVKEDSTCSKPGISARYCIVCEYEKEYPIALKKHVPDGDYHTDNDEHWHECKNCTTEDGKKTVFNLGKHSYNSIGYDAEQHWKYCKCGKIAEATAHEWTPVDPEDNGINRLEKCTSVGCGATRTASNGDHKHEYDMENGEITTQPTCSKEGVITYKCKVSGCKGYTTASINKAEHDYTGEVKHNDTHHWVSCSMCGGEPEATEKVLHDFSGKPTTDGYNKVYHCECGAVKYDTTGGYIDPDGWT